MSLLKEGRFRIGWVEGISGMKYPDVVDRDSGQIVSFGKTSDGNPGNQLFYDPGKAEEAARLLNQGRSPEDLSVHDPK